MLILQYKTFLSYNDIYDKKRKIPCVLKLARKLWVEGSYVISKHANLRQGQRQISIGDIKHVIFSGFHEKRKDVYKDEFDQWVYVVRGLTLDDDLARVCFSFFEDSQLVVITVIKLEEKYERN